MQGLQCLVALHEGFINWAGLQMPFKRGGGLGGEEGGGAPGEPALSARVRVSPSGCWVE